MAIISNNSPIEGLNNSLCQIKMDGSAPLICFLTGSSGCGKTYLCQAMNELLDPYRTEVVHFDSIGVPSEGEMIEGWGSGCGWQEAMTHEWVRRISKMTDRALVVFEGQYDPQFALDACREEGIEEFVLAVVSCDKGVWETRLKGPREQPELITEDMQNWARVLREKTTRLCGVVIDTSASNVGANIFDVVNLINPIVNSRIKQQNNQTHEIVRLATHNS